jgi:predicted O-methyltransferase YrrM
MLYALVRAKRPGLYVEIGAGSSTMFAARAREDGWCATRIVSIDPQQRAEIDELCDEVIRDPLEKASLAVWDQLRAGDVIFMDGSHRVFMNNDRVTFFLDILPELRPGVIVGVHDVYLPFDYLKEIADRYYSEQYLLAAWLLGRGRSDVLLPATWVWENMRSELDRLWNAQLVISGVERHGAAFWLRIAGRRWRSPLPRRFLGRI